MDYAFLFLKQHLNFAHLRRLHKENSSDSQQQCRIKFAQRAFFPEICSATSNSAKNNIYLATKITYANWYYNLDIIYDRSTRNSLSNSNWIRILRIAPRLIAMNMLKNIKMFKDRASGRNINKITKFLAREKLAFLAAKSFFP